MIFFFEVGFACYCSLYIKCVFQVDQCVKYIDMHSITTALSISYTTWQKFLVNTLLLRFNLWPDLHSEVIEMYGKLI